MYCPRCNRMSSGDICTECRMTEREAYIYDEGWDACLGYIKRLLPQERHKRESKHKRNE